MKQADLKYPDVRIPAEKRLPTGFLRTGNFHRGSAFQNTKIQRKLLATYAKALLGILKSHVKTQLQLKICQLKYAQDFDSSSQRRSLLLRRRRVDVVHHHHVISAAHVAQDDCPFLHSA